MPIPKNPLAHGGRDGNRRPLTCKSQSEPPQARSAIQLNRMDVESTTCPSLICSRNTRKREADSEKLEKPVNGVKRDASGCPRRELKCMVTNCLCRQRQRVHTFLCGYRMSITRIPPIR